MSRAPALLVSLILSSSALAAPPAQTADPKESSLTFVGTQQGEKFTGAFKSFQASVQYAANDLPGSRLEAGIDLKSVDSKSKERDDTLVGADWFDVAHFPKATFRSTAVRMTSAGPVADTELTLHGQSRKIAFPFRYTASGDTATLDAKVRLDRLDFGIGAGEWADDSVVGRAVEVNVHLVLRNAAARP